ncbi:MAG: hypothetical protein IBJ10_02200 [Phycisphaerales bacterium]|nr:hypothetical protein [Phycisphaerales bacterium]
MALRNNRMNIPEGPDWTDLMKSADLGGTDGLIGMSEALLSCAADSASAMEYRVEKPADPAGQFGTLQPGEAVKLRGSRSLIHHIVGRGVDGDATGGVENLDL